MIAVEFPQPTAFDIQLVAMARATAASAGVRLDRVADEVSGLLAALRTHAADARAGEVPEDEILDGAVAMCGLAARVIRSEP